MQTAPTKSHRFSSDRASLSSVLFLAPILGFILLAFAQNIGQSYGACLGLLASLAVVGYHRNNDDNDVVAIERYALLNADRLSTFGFGVLHFAALPAALFLFTYEGQTAFGWALHIMVFGAFFGTVSFHIGHALIHSTNPLYYMLGRAIYASMGYGSYVSAHLMVHHPRKGSDRDIERVRRGETILRYCARVYFSGLRLGRKAESLRRKKFNYGQLDVIHPHAQYVIIASATAGISALLFGPMGLVNLLMIWFISRMCALTSTYLRNKQGA